jgi:VIT1/CCC1 family predicted Fe2+/Mn2+ transporter
MPLRQKELHRTGRIGWLRAAVLGANDGIVSTASLVLGVAAAHGTRSNVLVAGVAGLVAGAMAMAAGEYVSVHSQADTEQAELKRERAELKADDMGEREELTAIYIARGLDPSLAKQVADQLMAHDAIGAHARDELGITEALRARPIQAAFASALSFAVGAVMPLLTTAFPGSESDCPCPRNFTAVSRALGGAGGGRGRRGCGGRRHTRDVLGCAGHGADCGCRGLVRNSGVSGANRGRCAQANVENSNQWYALKPAEGRPPARMKLRPR